MNARGLIVTLMMVLAGLLTGGCSVPSLSPLYSEDKREVTTDDRVVGEWMQVNATEKICYVIEKGEGTPASYMLRVVNKEEPEKVSGRMRVHLVTLGERVFADIYPDPDEDDEEHARSYGFGLIAAHVIARVEIEAGRLKVYQVDMDWLHDRLKAKSETPHGWVEGPEDSSDKNVPPMAVLTGTTEEVQAFITSIAGEAGAWSEAVVFEPWDEKKAKESAEGFMKKHVKETVKDAGAQGE